MMRLISCLACAAGFVLASAGLAAGAAAPAAPENQPYRVVYLGERGPILIELDLRIDGQPLRARHRAFLDKVFAYLDRDGDGVLSRQEAAAAPTAATLTNPLTPFLGRRLPNQRRLRPNEDGKVTRAEVAAYYRQTGLAAIQMSAPPTQNIRIRLANAGSDTTAEQMTDRLFKLLDTDGDGKLSRKELEAAPAILGSLDVNEDEMISPAELMGEAGGTGDYVPVLVARRPPPAASPRPLHVVADGAEDEALAKVLLARYGKAGDKFVSAAALALSKEALAVLDRDRDGKLSLAELLRFGSKPADVMVTFRLANRLGEPLMTLKSDRPLPAGVRTKPIRDGVSLQLGTTQLDLHSSGPITRRLPINVRNQLKTLFRRLDRDSKGYLEKKALGRGSPFSDTFDAMDRDRDGKVTEKELLAWFDQIESLRKLAERSCVTLVFSTEGKGLFDLLDADGDGRLSFRELRNAPKLLTTLNVRDGKLARGQVPRHYRGGLVLGPSVDDPFGRVVVANPRLRRPVARSARARGPLWFQKMDRNRDGDVSRKEFLGTDAQFKEIDTDGDGLISAEEAEAYDARTRK
jgi:Ca2+-binding EF-hand superfamily protein